MSAVKFMVAQASVPVRHSQGRLFHQMSWGSMNVCR